MYSIPPPRKKHQLINTQCQIVLSDDWCLQPLIPATSGHLITVVQLSSSCFYTHVSNSRHICVAALVSGGLRQQGGGRRREEHQQEVT
jgi:hypothetical protein